MTDCVKSSIGNRCITSSTQIYCVKFLSNNFICQNQIVCTQIIYTVNWQQSCLFTKYHHGFLQYDLSKLQISVDSILSALPSLREYEGRVAWLEYENNFIRNSKSQPPSPCPDLQRVQVLVLDIRAVYKQTKRFNTITNH